jgi:hypothetical protein
MMAAVIRRAAAVALACEALFLAFFALVAWELADGVLPEPGPPTPASWRLASAAPYLFPLPWFAVGTVALWSSQPVASFLRLGQRAVLFVVVVTNLTAASLFAAGRYASTAEAIVFIPCCLAVAGVSLLVIMGKLRGQRSRA